MNTAEEAQEHLSLGHKLFFDEPRDVEAAVREFRKVIELCPDWDEGYGWLSSALEELNHDDESDFRAS